MTFRIVPHRRAWWPVKFNGVTEEGDVIENQFELRFNRHDEEEFHALMKDIGGMIDAPEAGKGFVEAALPFARRMFTDWRGVAGENGEALPFNDENLALLVKQPGVWSAIGNAYRGCRAAEGEIRKGN